MKIQGEREWPSKSQPGAVKNLLQSGRNSSLLASGCVWRLKGRVINTKNRASPVDMNQNPIPDSSGFSVTPALRATFAGRAQFFELGGPGTLVRLVQSKKVTYEGLQLGSSRRDGFFWFDEAFFLRVRNQAKLELTRQQRVSGRPFSAPLDALVTLYMRHYLRSDLAVCKDFTHDFDGHVRMRLLPGDKMVALVGDVARQPAYSPAHAQHEAVVANEIWLEGQATQYVIDFNFAPNKAYTQRIQGPYEF